MPRTDDGFYWDLGFVTSSSVDDQGWVSMQIDFDGKEGGGDPGNPLFPYGFLSRPLDPGRDSQGRQDPSQSCEALYAWFGDKLLVLPIGDARKIKKMPLVDPGGSLLYSATGSFVRCHGSDGSVSAVASKDVDDGTKPTASWRLATDDGFVVSGPWGSLKIDFTGFHVLLSSGAEMHLGGIYGLPDPLSQLTTYFRVNANMTSLDSPVLALGAQSPGGHDNGVKASALMVVLVAMGTAIQQLQQSIALLAATPAAATFPPSSNPAVAASVAAGQVAVAPLSTPATVIKSATAVT